MRLLSLSSKRNNIQKSRNISNAHANSENVPAKQQINILISMVKWFEYFPVTIHIVHFYQQKTVFV